MVKGLNIQQGVSGPERAISDEKGDIQEIDELEWMRRHMKENPSETSRTASGIAGAGQDVHEPRTERYARNPGHLVVRKTGLRGQIAASAPPQQKVRCTTGGELVEQDVPDVRPPKAGRDKTCSRSGWKDLDFRSLLWMIMELQFRIEDLEAEVGNLKEKKGSS